MGERVLTMVVNHDRTRTTEWSRLLALPPYSSADYETAVSLAGSVCERSYKSRGLGVPALESFPSIRPQFSQLMVIQ